LRAIVALNVTIARVRTRNTGARWHSALPLNARSTHTPALRARHPLYLRELARAAGRPGDELPATLVAAIGAELAALTPRARRLLGGAAVAGARQSCSTSPLRRERRIAELVADGFSNKHVAATLFLSTKTVEASLTRTYAKLGVRSLTQLQRELASD
jgi:DNA-binding NarL/FixJ family response regulator